MFMLGCSVMAITAGFELVNLGSIPSTPTSFRIATANFKISLLMKPKMLSCFIISRWTSGLGH